MKVRFDLETILKEIKDDTFYCPNCKNDLGIITEYTSDTCVYCGYKLSKTNSYKIIKESGE